MDDSPGIDPVGSSNENKARDNVGQQRKRSGGCIDGNRTLPRAIHLTPHTQHLTHNTSHTTPHTPHPTPHTSHTTPHTSHLTSHLTPHTHNTSHTTPHTQNLTPHTQHTTPHTSRLTPHTQQLQATSKSEQKDIYIKPLVKHVTAPKPALKLGLA